MINSSELFAIGGDERDVESLEKLNLVWVIAGGSVHSIESFACPTEEGIDWRDVWNEEHYYWDQRSCGKRDFTSDYHNVVATFATGKALMAITAHVADGTGEILIDPFSVRCGSLREHCFAIPWTPSTSEATAILSSIMFHFMQLYDNLANAVSALKSCTRDVGEPGVDLEFGQGLIDLQCAEAMLPVIDRS